MPFKIVGLGTANPSHQLSADDTRQLLHRLCCENKKQERLADVLVRRSGVMNRQTCVPSTLAFAWESEPNGPTLGERMELFEQHASNLAIEAAREAMRNADVEGQQISHLVTVSCTGFESPGIDIELIRSLGLSASVQRVHVGFMGCHGAINALRVADGLVAADPSAAVLLVATELCSLHYCYDWNPDQLVGNAIFGDGSAAVIGVASGELLDRSSECQWTLSASGCYIVPNTEHLMSWRVRDHGFEMMLSPELPSMIQANLKPWLASWLESTALSVGKVGSWAVHPGGPKIITAVEGALHLDESKTIISKEVLRDHGNMSSPTILFILDRLRNSRADGPCVALGFGPGIAIEALLFE